MNGHVLLKQKITICVVVCFMLFCTITLTYTGVKSTDPAPTELYSTKFLNCLNGNLTNSETIVQKEHNARNETKEEKQKHEDPFKIIILTQRRYWSLDRLLKSVQHADYGGHKVSLEIRVDFDTSRNHQKTINLANMFPFKHGEKHVHVYNKKQGLYFAWFNAWRPRHDEERAVIIEDDMELSPLWFRWLHRAWQEYGRREDLGSISLCRQRLNASDGNALMFENNTPFLYRVFGSFGLSPNAKYWRSFADWVRRIDLRKTDVRVNGTVTTQWWEREPFSVWEQYWYWWCFSDRPLYTLYVHSRKGTLIAHWAEPGVHANGIPHPSDRLLTASEPVLETFPKELEHYGWNFKPENYTGLL